MDSPLYMAAEASSSSAPIAVAATLVAATLVAATLAASNTDLSAAAAAASSAAVVFTSPPTAAATAPPLAARAAATLAPSATTIPSPPSPEAVAAAVASGEKKAQAQAGRDDTAFRDENSVFGKSVDDVVREAAWMRREVSNLLQNDVSSAPPSLETGCFVLKRDLVNRRGGDGPTAALRARPDIYNYVTHDQRVYVINLASKGANLILAECGLGSLPCGNPTCYGSAKCAGSRSTWHTAAKRWSVTTSAPAVLLEANGFSSVLVCARSRCFDCNTQFSHLDPVVLRRLLSVSTLLQSINPLTLHCRLASNPSLHLTPAKPSDCNPPTGISGARAPRAAAL
jgi:hypothetical protein